MKTNAALAALDKLTTRKPSDWSEVEFLAHHERTPEIKAALAALPVIEAPEGYEPLRDFPTTFNPDWNTVGTRFLLTTEWGDFYINTEGSSYCRYALCITAR